MIVQCEQCQTRFRVPDEKVSDKGVRVRCTRCQHTFRVARPPAPAAVPASAAAPASPTVFDEPTRVGVLSSEELSRLGLSAPPPPPPVPAPAPRAVSRTPPPVPPASAAAPVRRAPADEPAFAHPTPSTVEAGLRRAASLAPAPAGAVALSTAQRPAPAAPAPALSSEELFGGFGEVDLSGEPAALPHAAPSLLGDLEPPPPELSGDSGPRAFSPSAADLENTRALFDLPRREVLPPLPAAAAEPAPEVAVTRTAPTPTLPIARPVGRAEDMGISETRDAAAHRTRQLLGLLANLGVAAALVLGLAVLGRAYLGEGSLALETLSSSRVRELLLPASQPLPLEDVSNGLYDTREGHPVFYVRGEVVNRTQQPVRVRVRATLFDGEQRVKGVEGLAGAGASPEQLHALASAEDALALRRTLDGQARVLAPGERAPFTLVFFEYPPELGAFRLELTRAVEAR